MKNITLLRVPSKIFRTRYLSFVRENGKMIAQFIFTAMFVGIGIWFVKHEHSEIVHVKHTLQSSEINWVIIGLIITLVYIFLQGWMYYTSFKTVNTQIGIKDAVILFLKRNFISVFLPAGGVSSLAFFTRDIEDKGINKSQIHLASSVYAFNAVLSVIVVAVPAFAYSVFFGIIGKAEWIGLASVILLLTGIFYLYKSLIRKGRLYKIIIKISPSSEIFFEELRNYQINNYQFIRTLLISVVIELVGIAHLYIAMKALHLVPSLLAAIVGYIVACVFLIISPFLRGLGAIEISLAYLLTRFGFTNVESIAITLLYRFFEFWTPLVMGLLSFLLKINKLLIRIIPAMLIFMLGIINIISVLTPSINWRIERLQNFLFPDAILLSNYFVMASGLFLLVTAAFMLKGLRSAWWFALILSIGSFIGHITKALDFEEAILALFVIINLAATRKQYYIKSNPRLFFVGVQTSLLSILAVIVYGTLGFYFLDKKHFSFDLTWPQSVLYTIENYLLIGSPNLVASDPVARNFITSIKISGLLSMAFLIYTFIRPYVIKNNSSPEEIENAKALIKSYGKSVLDYFKTYPDKLIFFQKNTSGFVSYRVSGNFAVCLENPVAENDEQMKQCISEFDKFCYENGLKSLYYRIPEESLPVYKEKNKKFLFIGQEGVVDLNAFSLEGGSRRSLRNGINKVNERGYKANVHEPPVKDGLLQKIKSVSDEWLTATERNEIIFSQGMFIWEELKTHTIITVENTEEKIVAFLNIIPDFATNEGTYDLLRKTSDAPNGVMDFLLIRMFDYFRSQNIRFVNLGFAPLSGLTNPQNLTERSMKFAYHKIRAFSHYKGLRDFKEKYSPAWHNKYLIYENDYDLFQIPSALSKVIKP